MTVVDRLRRGEDLEQALNQLVVLLQADELDLDDLDQAVRHADTLLADSAERETRNAERVTAPDSDTEPAKTAASSQKLCEVDGCGNKHLAKGYCAGHYSRYRKHGDAQADIPLGETTPGVPLGQQSQKERAEDAPIPDEKACGECGETKPLDDFPTNKRTRDGHQGRCFDCFRAGAAKARAAQAAKRAPTNGSEPAGARRSPKPADAGSTPARPATHEPSTDADAQPAAGYVEAHMDNMIGAVSGPYRTFTLVDQRGNDVAVEQHPEPHDPPVWAAVLARVHTAVHDEPVVVTHQPAGGGNGQAPVQHHQAGIR